MKITIREAVGWIDAEIDWCREHVDAFVPSEPGETAECFIRGLEQAKRIIEGIPEATPKPVKKETR